jgi:hypothetical protein
LVPSSQEFFSPPREEDTRGEASMELEEVEALWQKLRQHEKDIRSISARNLQLARDAASFLVISTYNYWITNIRIFLPQELDSFIEYMKPRKDAVLKIIKKSRSVKNIFGLAAELQKNCLDYYEGHRER